MFPVENKNHKVVALLQNKRRMEFSWGNTLEFYLSKEGNSYQVLEGKK